MLISRRSLCASMAAFLVGSDWVYARECELPAANDLQIGDFLWSKPPCTSVPFNFEVNHQARSPEQIWNDEIEEFISDWKTRAPSTTKEQLNTIENLTFNDFLKLFHGDNAPVDIAKLKSKTEEFNGAASLLDSQERDSKMNELKSKYSLQTEALAEILSWHDIAEFFGKYCGHAAVVGSSSSASGPNIIEAQFQKSVARVKYDDFCNLHADNAVWHGRLTDFSESERAKVGERADYYASLVPPPKYDFFNFDLTDAHSFYCSKLPWLCVKETLNFSLGPQFLGILWFTPLIMITSSRIAVLGSRTTADFHNRASYCDNKVSHFGVDPL